MQIEGLLQIIRNQPSPDIAWLQILDLCRTDKPNPLWDALPRPNFRRDERAVLAWLKYELIHIPSSSGIYLGLDTLNMDVGSGTNIEIGWCSPCDTARNDIDWIYEHLNNGSGTLIQGLFDLHAVYSQPQWEATFSYADYMLFLAYSGLVLREAFSKWSPPLPCLLAWGFHDGDMFILGRSTPNGFELVCK